jgi:hypothetical protein
MIADWQKIPGLQESLGKESAMVTSNYDPESVKKTAEFIKLFQGGTALFTQPSTPIKCAGAPQKIAYLAEEAWRSRGLLSDGKTQVKFNTGMGKIFAVDKYAKSLESVCQNRDIQVNLGHELVEIRPERREGIIILFNDAYNNTS